MPPSYYDPYGRRPRRGPQGDDSQVLTAAQIAKIEAAFEELNKKAAHWETQAKQWQATASESQAVAGEWQERVKALERALAESHALANEARDNCTHWQETASEAQTQFDSWEAKASELESEAAQAEQRVIELETALVAAQEGHSEEAERLKQIEADFLNSKQPVGNREEAEAYLTRLAAVQEALDGALESFRVAVSQHGAIPPDFVVDPGHAFLVSTHIGPEYVRRLRAQRTRHSTNEPLFAVARHARVTKQD